jgi:glycopeptide antibiotics resistance protein
VSRQPRSALEGGTPTRAGRRPLLPAWLAWAAAAGYAVVLALVTLAPVRLRSGFGRYRNNWKPQLVPVWNLVVNLRDGDRVMATLAGAAGNVALFLPFGFLLPLLAPRMDRWWWTVGAGFALSTAIELTQIAFPGLRHPDVNDVLMNTLGAALGFAAYRLAARLRAA